jgi:predicted nucleic acid-binding protein
LEALVVAHEVKGKLAHDARLAAAMQRHAITHLLTFNGVDFGRFSFLISFSPFDLMNGSIKL